MQIGEFAAHTGVAPRLLRYYEQHALLTPGRDERGWRVYSDADEARLREIRTLIEAGLPVRAIAQLLTYDGDEVRRGSRITPALLEELASVRERLDGRIRCLTRNRDALDAWLHSART